LDAYAISWSASTGADGYLLQEDDNAAFSSPETRYMGSALEYPVTGQAGGTWYYRVQAYNDGGDSSWSNTQSTTVTPSSLGSPTMNAISNPEDDGAYAVNWSSISGATSYILEESRSPYFESPTEIYTGTLVQFDVTDQNGGTWYYRVRATNITDSSPWSNSQSTWVNDKIFLPVVFNSHSTSSYFEPTPGFWEGAAEEFYVTPDGGSVDLYAIYVSVDGCGNYKITHLTPVPAIVSNQFWYSGSFYFSGTFDTSTTASGTEGLNFFDLYGCGLVSGGPWSWSANWVNSSQPTVLSAELVAPVLVESLPSFPNAYHVIKLDP
jgi:hypothetical protein